MTSFLFRLLLNLKGKKSCFKNYIKDFPSGTVDKTPPSSAGDSSSVPSLGDLTSLGATKPVHHNWHLGTVDLLLHKRSHHSEKPVHHNWRAAPTRCGWSRPASSSQGPAQPEHVINEKRNPHNWAWASNWENSPWSFLRGCSWVTILSLIWIKLHFFHRSSN